MTIPASSGILGAVMVSDGAPFLRQSPHMVFLPGMATMLTVLGFNLLGDGLRDALDPQMPE
jgi:peptide/nickel transport system permease protein